MITSLTLEQTIYLKGEEEVGRSRPKIHTVLPLGSIEKELVLNLNCFIQYCRWEPWNKCNATDFPRDDANMNYELIQKR